MKHLTLATIALLSAAYLIFTGAAAYALVLLGATLASLGIYAIVLKSLYREFIFKNLFEFLGSKLFRLVLMSGPLLALGSLGLLAAYIIRNASAEANQAAAEGMVAAGDISAEGAATMATQEPTDENLVQKRKVRLLADRPFSEKSIINRGGT